MSTSKVSEISNLKLEKWGYIKKLSATALSLIAKKYLTFLTDEKSALEYYPILSTFSPLLDFNYDSSFFVKENVNQGINAFWSQVISAFERLLSLKEDNDETIWENFFYRFFFQFVEGQIVGMKDEFKFDTFFSPGRYVVYKELISNKQKVIVDYTLGTIRQSYSPSVGGPKWIDNPYASIEIESNKDTLKEQYGDNQAAISAMMFLDYRWENDTDTLKKRDHRYGCIPTISCIGSMVKIWLLEYGEIKGDEKSDSRTTCNLYLVAHFKNLQTDWNEKRKFITIVINLRRLGPLMISKNYKLE